MHSISIVIPAYNEEGNIPKISDKIIKTLKSTQLNYEIMFIDDGSTDNSWSIIKSLTQEYEVIKAIKFSRNFGHDIAIKAGLDHSNADITIVMDSDLQHPPEIILSIIDSIKKDDCDIVLMKRTFNKGKSIFRSFINKIYYKLFSAFTKIKLEEGISDFFAVNKKVLRVLKNIHQKNIFIRGVLQIIGFRKKIIEYQANERHSGKSKYNFRSLLSLSKKSFIGFTYLPLRITEIFGLLLSFLSFLYGFYSIIKTLLIGSISGWASTITTISFLNGFILLLLAFYIEYFIVAMDELKETPQYIIEEENE